MNLISPPTSHARLLSLFYVIAYIANWVPILLGVVVDRVDLRQATHLLFLSSSAVCLLLAWKTSGWDSLANYFVMDIYFYN